MAPKNERLDVFRSEPRDLRVCPKRQVGEKVQLIHTCEHPVASVILWSFRADSERGFSSSAREVGRSCEACCRCRLCEAKRALLRPLLSVGLNAALPECGAYFVCVFKCALTGLPCCQWQRSTQGGTWTSLPSFSLVGITSVPGLFVADNDNDNTHRRCKASHRS